MKEYITDWEVVPTRADGAGVTLRYKVPTGWLVKNSRFYNGKIIQSLTFVPDPNHEWKLLKSEVVRPEPTPVPGKG